MGAVGRIRTLLLCDLPIPSLHEVGRGVHSVNGSSVRMHPRTSPRTKPPKCFLKFSLASKPGLA
jgi:hypothetical protein